MQLFKLGVFEFDLTSIISFLVGILLGALLVCLGYLLAVLFSLRTKNFFSKIDDSSETKDEIKTLVINTQKAFKDKELRGNKGMVSYCKDLSISLASTIAARFFPNSKYPLLELSVDETIILVDYIEKRVDDILNKRGLRLLRRLKVSKIFSLSIQANKINNSSLIKAGKEVSGDVSTVKKVINTVNPAWWFKKLVMDTSLNAIETKICTVVIAIVGEETYKIYSKRVFNQDVEIETNISEIMTEINNDLLEATTAPEEAKVVKNSSIKYKTKAYSPYYNVDIYKSIYNSNKGLKKHESKKTNAFTKLTNKLEARNEN